MGEIDPRLGGLPRFGETKILFFDVFGTVVDWRSSVTAELIKQGKEKGSSSNTPESLQQRIRELTKDDWANFAQQWRASYGKFTTSFVPGETEPKDIDTHHYDSLIEHLQTWGIKGAFSDEEIRDLSLVWHRLSPWPDSSKGLALLNTKYQTSTLSNGNVELLRDLKDFGKLSFQHVVSSWEFEAYKPHPSVYLGAAQKNNFEPKECALVAAHLGDLRAAKNLGFRAIYVERPREEAFSADAVAEARHWVDMWIAENEEGFVEVAKKLDIS
ncbi:haloacid dehalogenase [Seiridium cupressi]